MGVNIKEACNLDRREYDEYAGFTRDLSQGMLLNQC